MTENDRGEEQEARHVARRRGRKSGCALWFVFGCAVLFAVVIVAALATGAGDDPDDGEGPVTNSGNTENPPDQDIVLTACGPGVGNPAGGNLAGASGTITNHSSQASSYVFSVEFVGQDGIRYAEAPGASTAVAPDQTVEWAAPTMDEFREGSTCRVAQVERVAS